MAADVLDVGTGRVKIVDAVKAQQAMTKDDVRGLINSGAIECRPIIGVSRARGREIAHQKKKGLRKSVGSRRGTAKTRMRPKEIWMKKVRGLRIALNDLKPKLAEGQYRALYMMIKGGYFRDRKHLKLYVTEKKLLKG